MRMETKQSNVKLFMNELDAESRSIISYLLIKKHARINELSNLINENDTLTLIKIKEIINPLAEKIFGTRILVFKESAIDVNEGRKVSFSWWMENSEELIEEQKKELIDIFDEKNYVKVVMELPGSKNIKAEINGNELTVTAEKSDEKICRKVSLSADVKKIIGKRYNNGVLEIKIEKKRIER